MEKQERQNKKGSYVSNSKKGGLDYLARQTINGRQSPTIAFENMEAYYFF